ncbi:hypothetical protein [Nocardia niigatensis]|uniref:hypothetical protein n=1 Tax=Nocardia niigatensis TaxID=209249 RepID=UPI0002EF1384|nr:hypothetical protein [Nocardia niigatensis]
MLASVAFVVAPLSLVMMVVSSVVYLFSGDGNGVIASTPGSSHWLIMTGFEWFLLAVAAGVAGFVLSGISARLGKAERAQEQAAREIVAAADRKAQEKAWAEAERRRIQQELNDTVRDANRSASSALDRLPGHLQAAMDFLGQAEIDWKERVYNPFWSSIEGCTVKLSDFKDDVETIESSANRYLAAAPRIEGLVPPFSVSEVSVAALDAYEGIYDALAKMTRRALGDIEFATIFEAWRGNAIMEKGFSGLRAAVTQMGTAIAGELSTLRSSIDQLGRSVHSGLSDISAVVRGQSAALADQSAAMSQFHEENMQFERDRARREQIVVDQIRYMRIDQKYRR